MAKKVSSHFERFNDLVDRRVCEMGREEIIAWLVYERHANKSDAMSGPGNDRIAKAIGHKDDSHVSRARNKLLEGGMISIAEGGDGKGNLLKVQMLLPDLAKVASDGNLFDNAKVANTADKGCQNVGTKVANTADKGCQNGFLHNKEEQLNTTASETASETQGGFEDDGNELVKPADRNAARRAFDQWSHVSRGHGLNEIANESKRIIELLNTLAQGAPIIRNGASMPAHLFVAQAADALKAEGEIEFKHIAYVCACVKTRIEKWIREGIGTPATPGTGTKNGQPKPPRLTAEQRGEFAEKPRLHKIIRH